MRWGRTVDIVYDLIVPEPASTFLSDYPMPVLTGKSSRKLLSTKSLNFPRNYQDHINQSVPNKETFLDEYERRALFWQHTNQVVYNDESRKTIFYGLLEKPTVVNQRIIGFDPLDNGVNIELCHALLNTVLGAYGVIVLWNRRIL